MDPRKSPDRLMCSYPEAAHIIGCSPRYVWGLVNSTNELGCVRMGRRVMIPYDEIIRWIERNTKGGNGCGVKR